MILGPERVRVILRDGTEVPVEVAYSHESGGVAIWRNIHPVHGEVARVTASFVPPGIAIEIITSFD